MYNQDVVYQVTPINYTNDISTTLLGVFFILFVLLVVLINNYYYNDDFMNYDMEPTKGEKIVVWIKDYVKLNGVWKERVYEKNNVDILDYTQYTWRWIQEKSCLGWVMMTPPPEPTIIASEGMLEIANEILAKQQK